MHTAATAADKAAPAANSTPVSASNTWGSKLTMVTPKMVSAMPTQRRICTTSPRKMIESMVAKGTFNCATTATTEAAVMAMPMNIKPK